MKKRSMLATIFVLLALVLGADAAFAGDVATFVDLGFSPDSAYFMFGQYGLDQAAGKPYAETYLVDAKRNDFVDKGVIRRSFDVALEPGQDASGALFSLLGEEQALVKKCKIDHLLPGRLLYVLMDGQEPPASLSFRDFKTGASYEVSLSQSSSEVRGQAAASFGIAMSYSAKEGAVSKRVVGGNPDIKRQGVKSYAIRRIIAAPDEKTLIFIVEKRTVDKGDPGIRYMAEALRLP
jgi:predicted secreted protein